MADADGIDPCVTLRVAVETDALCLGVLGMQVFLDTYATDGIRPILAREVLAQFDTGAVRALLARPAKLDRLYVQEAFTGTGLGSALLRRAEAIAGAVGVDVLWLSTWVGNRRALEFYPRRGYRDVGATIYAFEDERHENRLFAKRLHDDR